MSADTVLMPAGGWPIRRTDQAPPPASRDDPVSDLATRFRSACRQAVDPDEVAALLEASGINDRVAAARYGHPDVFSLATELRRRIPVAAVPQVAATTPLRVVVRQALVRWALYLTPLAVVLGAAREVARVPVAVTTAVLVLGWAVSQGLGYLGYGVLSRRGAAAAARFLAAGYLTVAAGCLTVVWWVTRSVLALAVASIGLAMFAAVTVVLVTGRETVLLRWTLPCWVAAGVLTAVRIWLPGVALARRAGLVLLVVAIGLLIVVAYRPMAGATVDVPGFALADLGRAVCHTVLGESQAGLFVAVVLSGAGAAEEWRSHLDYLPLLLATPLTEVVVVRHRERIVQALRVFEELADFRRYARRVAARTLGAVLLPVLATGGVAFAITGGGPDSAGLRYGSAAVLAGLFAVTLLLALQQRLYTAALLIAAPAAVVGAVTLALTRVTWADQPFSPAAVVSALSVSQFWLLAAALGVGVALCVPALLDPRGYR